MQVYDRLLNIVLDAIKQRPLFDYEPTQVSKQVRELGDRLSDLSDFVVASLNRGG